jgi:hypothetical protein
VSHDQSKSNFWIQTSLSGLLREKLAQQYSIHGGVEEWLYQRLESGGSGSGVFDLQSAPLPSILEISVFGFTVLKF